MATDLRTRAYVERRATQGLSKPEIIRCLKRYAAREIYKVLTRPETLWGSGRQTGVAQSTW